MPILAMAFGFLRGPARSFLAGIPREVWYALAAAALLAVAYWHGKAVEHRADAVTLATVRRDLATETGNVDTLKAAIAAQNAAAAKWQGEATKAQQATAAALERAGKADAAAAGIRASAGKLAKAVPVGPCVDKAGDNLAQAAWSKL